MSTPLVPTAGQTVGPFFGFALPYPGGPQLVPPGTPGAVQLTGQVRDGHGSPIPDALIELWQAAPDGGIVARAGSLRRDGWTFTGWGRAATDTVGRYSFTTFEPGPVGGGARYVALTVFARGLANRLFTRAYLPGAALDGDRVLASVPPERRDTLIVSRDGPVLTFDIVLQGEGETVFLQHAGNPAR